LNIMDEYIAVYDALAQGDRTAAQTHIDAVDTATAVLQTELANLGITGVLPED
jgi:hypothetical protein